MKRKAKKLANNDVQCTTSLSYFIFFTLVNDLCLSSTKVLLYLSARFPGGGGGGGGMQHLHKGALNSALI